MQDDRMRRRDFMALLGGAAMWPLDARAQQATIPKVGLLILTNPEPYWSFLTDGFRERGYVGGKNILLEFRSAEGNSSVLAEQAAELVRAKVDLVFAIQTPAVQAAKQATKDIPIVLIAGAPVETGLVENLSRPGGNITGVSTTGPEVTAKTLEIMRDTLPSLRRVAVLVNAADIAYGTAMLDQIKLAARSLSIEVQSLIVGAPDELGNAFVSIADGGAQAVIVQPSLPRGSVLEFARKYRIPAITSSVSWAEAGAFMSYGADTLDTCRKAVGYADRILKGSRPADLPVEQPTKFELVVNLKTAKVLGIEIPPLVLVRDARVIE